MKRLNAIKGMILVLVVTTGLTSFITQDNKGQCDKEAKILGLDPSRCECCWGWIMLVDNDTIKVQDIPFSMQEFIGYKGKFKIKVGEKVSNCTSQYPIYKVECFEKTN